MREITEFSLERHAGEYATWPLRSRLIRNGAMQDLTLPGYDLLRQYETVAGYLFVTDYDCPFEEMTHFVLVDANLSRVLCDRSFGWMYASFWLDELFWHDERHFSAVLSHYRYDFAFRSFSIPLLLPRIKLIRAPYPVKKQQP